MTAVKLTRGHLAKTWYIPGVKMTRKDCRSCSYSTGPMKPREAFLAFRQHRKDEGEVVAPLRIKITYHLGDSVLIPLGHGRAAGMIRELRLTVAGPVALVRAHAGDAHDSMREVALIDLEVVTCSHPASINGLHVTQEIP